MSLMCINRTLDFRNEKAALLYLPTKDLLIGNVSTTRHSLDALPQRFRECAPFNDLPPTLLASPDLAAFERLRRPLSFAFRRPLGLARLQRVVPRDRCNADKDVAAPEMDRKIASDGTAVE
jgi:hypothetical protein